MKRHLFGLIIVAILMISIFQPAYADTQLKHGTCSMTINSAVNINGNFAQASGPCNGLERGFYSVDQDHFMIMGIDTLLVTHDRQQFKIIIPGSSVYLDATLTVHTVKETKPTTQKTTNSTTAPSKTTKSTTSTSKSTTTKTSTTKIKSTTKPTQVNKTTTSSDSTKSTKPKTSISSTNSKTTKPSTSTTSQSSDTSKESKEPTSTSDQPDPTQTDGNDKKTTQPGKKTSTKTVQIKSKMAPIPAEPPFAINRVEKAFSYQNGVQAVKEESPKKQANSSQIKAHKEKLADQMLKSRGKTIKLWGIIGLALLILAGSASLFYSFKKRKAI